jgi:hypothetical protein
MNLSKSYEFFQPEKDASRIHIVGCGSVGSTVAENLARCGLTNFTLWDFDTVEPHNIVNQIFTQSHIGMSKVEALKQILIDINPEIADRIETKPDGWQGKLMSGYVFLCVDSIDLRREIVEKHYDSIYVKAMFDFRTLLESAQHYAADWSNLKMKKDFLGTMQFTHDEAAVETPVSACGTTLGVATTVRLVSALGVNNYINFLKERGIKKFVEIKCFQFDEDSLISF